MRLVRWTVIPTEVSCLLLALLVPTALLGCSAGPVEEHMIFECAGQQKIDVHLWPGRATLVTSIGRFDLTARPSSIGRKYSSDAATLIIDDEFAAFVTKDQDGFRDCKRSDD